MDKNIIYLIIAATIIIFFYIIPTYNYFKRQKQDIEQSRSNIEVALTNRYDALVKINKTVAAYSGHEAATLSEVVKLRKGMTTAELNEASEQMDNAYSNLAALIENYPDLKASSNFMYLQDTIFDIENTIQATRRIFNREVSSYNKKVNSFPSCFVAVLARAKTESFFEAEQKKLQDVELQF